MADVLHVRDAVDSDVDDIISLWHAAGVSRPWNNPHVDIAFARRGKHSTILVGLMGSRVVAMMLC